MISYDSQIKCEKLRDCLNPSVHAVLVHSLLNSPWTLRLDSQISVILKAKIKSTNNNYGRLVKTEKLLNKTFRFHSFSGLIASVFELIQKINTQHHAQKYCVLEETFITIYSSLTIYNTAQYFETCWSWKMSLLGFGMSCQFTTYWSLSISNILLNPLYQMHPTKIHL